MKKYLFFPVIFLLTAFVSFSQDDSTLHWKTAAKKISDSVYELKVSAVIPAGWYLYGANPNIDGLGTETVQFNYEYENAYNTGTENFSGNTEQITDATFENKKVNVYTG